MTAIPAPISSSMKPTNPASGVALPVWGNIAAGAAAGAAGFAAGLAAAGFGA